MVALALSDSRLALFDERFEHLAGVFLRAFNRVCRFPSGRPLARSRVA